MDAQPKSRASVDRERNAELLRAVLAESEHLLRRQARRHAELLDDVDDALQSAYLLFIERYRGDCDPLAWLYTTVKREAWGLRRRPSRRRVVSLDTPCEWVDAEQPWVEAIASTGPEPDTLAIRQEALHERKLLLDQLKPAERRALLLLGAGFSYTEICEATGWTYTKVNRCLAEGRAALRRRLAAAP